MSEAKATTMELPVPLVRKIARMEFNFQRESIEKNVVKEAKRQNDYIAVRNKGLFIRLGLSKPQLPFDIDTVYEDWKQLFLSDAMDSYHPAYFIFARSRSAWWKRLMQFCELPEQDDGRTIRMSMEDLNLIDYNYHVKKLNEEVKE